jgi:hypothetical protein
MGKWRWFLMKVGKWCFTLSGLATSFMALMPASVWADGEAATHLVVVADTRRIPWGVMRYFADLYNANPLLFAVWAVVLTAAFGAILGFIMDLIMSRTGLDLRSRKIVEH